MKRTPSIHPTANDLRKVDKLLKAEAQGRRGLDLVFTPEEIKVWLLRAYGEGYKWGFKAGRNSTRKGKTQPSEASYQRKRLKQRNKFLAKLAPELIPEPEELPMEFTEEEMEMVADKEI